MLTYAWSGSNAPLTVGNFTIDDTTIGTVRGLWLDKLRDGESDIREIEEPYRKCLGRSAIEFVRKNDCDQVLSSLGIEKPSFADISPVEDSDEQTKINQDRATIFQDQVSRKIRIVLENVNTLRSGYQKLINDVNDKLKDENFKGSIPFNYQFAKDLADPKANPMTAYQILTEEIINEGFEAYVNRSVNAIVNQGWNSDNKSISLKEKLTWNFSASFST